MKSTRTIISNALILTLILAGSMVFAQNPPEIERALQVQGARVTLPVSAAITKDVFTPEFIRGARENFNNFHFQMGGDHALYYAMHLEEFMPSTESAPNINYKPLERDLRPELRYVTQTTSQGDLSLEEYMNHPVLEDIILSKP